MSISSGVKVFIRRSLPIFVVLLLLCAFGCSSKEKELVGTWNNNFVPETLEFRADKTGTIIPVDQRRMEFTWQESANHKYSLDLNFRGQKTVLNAIVQDNTLTLESSTGKETYTKKH